MIKKILSLISGKSVVKLAEEYNAKEANLRKQMVGKMTTALDVNKAKATACKNTIKALEQEKEEATLEVSMATQHIKKLTSE